MSSNKTKELIYQQKVLLNQENKGNVKLPPEMAINPYDDLNLEFEMLDPDGKAIPLRDYVKLVAPEYVTHLATDRPMYRPGDTVRFRSLTLERFSLKPAQQDFHLLFRITGPRGEIYKREVTSQVIADKNDVPVKGPDGQPLRGLGVAEFTLPAGEPEGYYTLSVSEVNERFNEERRNFQVRRVQTPRYNKEITFHRSAYAPGDQVKVRVRITPLLGQAPVAINGVQVTAVAKVDAQNLNVERPNNIHFGDNELLAEFQFTLPPNLARGVGTVTITCDDQDKTVRLVPIHLRDLTVDFYPEGGDLIAGVPNRVYFQARTPAGKPADFEGVVFDGRQEIARIQTLTDESEPGINQDSVRSPHAPGQRRYQCIESPIGIDRQFNLPQVKTSGVVLHVPQGVVDNEINVVVHSAQAKRDLLIGAYCRGRMLDHKTVKAGPTQPIEVTLRPQAAVGGVYRITVFEKVHENDTVSFRPVAERLIYRKNQTHVDVAINADRSSYQPGEPVQLRLQARNEKRQLTPSIAMVAVFDGNASRIADDKTERTMPTHFLLTTEVRNPEDLENADVLLGNHPKAAVALDLLLGAQGWRRFAEQDPGVFAQKQQQAKAPSFLTNSIAVPQILEAEQKQMDKLDQAYVFKAIALNKDLAEKEKDDDGPAEAQKKLEAAQMNVQMSQNDVNAAINRVREMRGFLWQFGLGGALLTLLFIGFFLVSVGLRKLSEGGRARPWFFSGAVLLALLSASWHSC